MKIKLFSFLLLFSTQVFSFDLTSITNQFADFSLFDDEKKFQVERAERLFAFVDVLYLDSDAVLTANYHNYDYDMFYQGKNIFSRPFDSDTYQLVVQESYSRSWHKFIDDYDSIEKTVDLLLSQYKDIAERLSRAYESKEALREKYRAYYRDEQYLQPINDDISHLSALGWQLTIVTRRFHDAVRPILVNRAMTMDRAKAHLDIVGELNHFNEQVGYAQEYSAEAVENSLEATIENVSQAVYELDQAKQLLNNP